jgi:hypothetical protein
MPNAVGLAERREGLPVRDHLERYAPPLQVLRKALKVVDRMAGTRLDPIRRERPLVQGCRSREAIRFGGPPTDAAEGQGEFGLVGERRDEPSARERRRVAGPRRFAVGRQLERVTVSTRASELGKKMLSWPSLHRTR